MSFSNLLSAADLNDFISPSQACIKPPEVLVESKKKREITQGSDGDLQVGKEGDDEPSTSTTTTISLADCLACSGCITSAESVLITQQSHTQVYEALKGVEQGAGPVQLVLSISPQARASFAAKLSFSRNKNIPGHQQDYLQYQDLDETRIHRKLDFFFKHVLNTSSPYQYVNNSALPTTTTNTTTTKYVVDTSYSRDLSLIETAREFVAKYKAASYSSGSSSQDQQQLLPLLTSACPGWICYAEKTHPHIIPYISTVKSPQQIMGSLVKHYLTSTSSVSTSTTTTSTTTTTSPPPLIKNNSNNNNIYHVSVMPCYDKKLEASRQDFIDDVTRSKDVDCVITTGEVELMLKEHGISSLDLLPDGDVDEILTKSAVDPVTGKLTLMGTDGSSSGGYLAFTLKHAALALFNISVSYSDIENGTGAIQIKMGRNSDMREYILIHPSTHQPLLRFASAYGFRNIQNLVRRVKKKKHAVHGSVVDAKRSTNTNTTTASYDFVEVMACPSGCVNGGGQLKQQEDASSSSTATTTTTTTTVEFSASTAAARQHISLVEQAYHATSKNGIGSLSAEVNPGVASIYRDWLGETSGDLLATQGGEKTQRMLHTQYHAVNDSSMATAAAAADSGSAMMNVACCPSCKTCCGKCKDKLDDIHPQLLRNSVNSSTGSFHQKSTDSLPSTIDSSSLSTTDHPKIPEFEQDPEKRAKLMHQHSVDLYPEMVKTLSNSNFKNDLESLEKLEHEHTK